jgi:cytidylate kinase
VSRPSTIAIDGPAGSGKTVVGLWLARELGYAFLDTGVLYRALTYLALGQGVAPSDGPALAALAAAAAIVVEPHPERGYRVRLDGRDVTEQLFSAEVNASVSPVAAHAEVRRELLPLQRRIARDGRVVMVGRDVGTVVLPNADLKLYLDASDEERARRRWEQEQRRRSLAHVLADVRQRDRIDSERAASPLRPADDAVVIDTDGMSLEQEQARIRELVGAS